MASAWSDSSALETLRAGLPAGRVLAVLDVVLIVWTLGWVVAGFRVAHEIDGLTKLSDTVTAVGEAVDASGNALQSLAGVPLVGDRLSEPAQRIRQAGQSAMASGQTSRSSIQHLSPLLGFAVALIPTVPLLALYVPLRVAVARDRRSAARLVARYRGDPRLQRLLAERAIGTLPYAVLGPVALDGDGHGDAATRRLAEAELARVGVGRPREW